MRVGMGGDGSFFGVEKSVGSVRGEILLSDGVELAETDECTEENIQF